MCVLGAQNQPPLARLCRCLLGLPAIDAGSGEERTERAEKHRGKLRVDRQAQERPCHHCGGDYYQERTAIVSQSVLVVHTSRQDPR